jgi:hypothetical protein
MAKALFNGRLATDPEAFRDYLDGFFNGIDLYPECPRETFLRNDAYALWRDFLRVALEQEERRASHARAVADISDRSVSDSLARRVIAK